MKLKKRIISSILTFAMMAGMIFGTSSLTMAQQGSPNDPDGNVPKVTTTTARIDLHDMLHAQEGGVYPNVTEFKWEITPVSFQPASAAVGTLTAAQMPRVNNNTKVDANVTVTRGTGSNPDLVTKVDATIAPASPKHVWAKAFIDFDDDAKIGVYTYKINVLDESTTYPAIPYDEIEEYYFDIYVTNQVDNYGVATGNVTIEYVTSWDFENPNTTTAPTGNAADFGGVAADASDTDAKTGFGNSPDTDTVGPNGSTVAGYQTMPLEFPFNFGYAVNTLTVKKFVTGNYASNQDVFSYLVTITDTHVPETTTYPVSYEGGAGPISGNPIEIQVGVATTIRLQDKQSFEIKSLPKDATYTVVEQANSMFYRGAAAYTAGHANLLTAGTANPFVVKGALAVEGNNNDPNATPADPFVAADINDQWIYADVNEELHGIGAAVTVEGSMETKVALSYQDTNGNQIDRAAGTLEPVEIVFTNERTVVTPTGLLINYWPYIVAVIAVLAAAGIFVGVKMKKRKSGVDTGAGL